MSTKVSEIKERLIQYVDYKGFKQRPFCRVLGVSESFLKNKGGFNVDVLPVLSQKYPDFNMYWLLFGEGKMILNTNNSNISVNKVEEDEDNYKKLVQNPTIEALQNLVKTKDELLAMKNEKLLFLENELQAWKKKINE